MKKLAILLLVIAPALAAQERQVSPTWLHRYVPSVRDEPVDLSSGSCHYTSIFGEGDAASHVPQSVRRFGELRVDARGACAPVAYPRAEELYFVLDGSGVLHYGDETHSLAKDDFTYVPPTVRRSISNTSGEALRMVVATVRIRPELAIGVPPASPTVANLSELKEQVVEGHPTSVLYKLLIGPRTAARDRINATYQVADFFFMDFAPGGTNFPHHHEVAEEIYLVLDGEGKMAAGGGMDGVEGLHAARAGDAYYFRPNCTVGFYNQNAAKAHILALRVFVPLPKNPD